MVICIDSRSFLHFKKILKRLLAAESINLKETIGSGKHKKKGLLSTFAY